MTKRRRFDSISKLSRETDKEIREQQKNIKKLLTNDYNFDILNRLSRGTAKHNKNQKRINAQTPKIPNKKEIFGSTVKNGIAKLS